ncbi:MAG: hypothetical protein ACUVXF_11225 [Desulfobaccales bacterium]
MGVTRETNSGKLSVKLDSEEMERIVQARKNLDDIKALAIYGARYANLGWTTVALEAQSGRDLYLDFSQPQTLRTLMDLALQRIQVQLAIRLNPSLFVLRVRPALAQSLLDRLENWRSSCISRLGEVWEHHFWVLPREWHLCAGPTEAGEEAPLAMLGPGAVVMVPPTPDRDVQDSWTWLSPPWEQPVGPPPPELLIIFEECGFLSRKAIPAPEDLPTWNTIFPALSKVERLLYALLAPEEDREQYYRKILQEALRAGFRESKFLLGLLWHAPHGEARSAIGTRQFLSRWQEEIDQLLAVAASRFPFAGPGKDDSGTPALDSLSSLPAALRQEFEAWEAQTAALEEQLRRLEGPTGAPDLTTGGTPGSFGRDKPYPGELEDLRRAVEEFLTAIDNLPEPE